jgi:hypothetical protein
MSRAAIAGGMRRRTLIKTAAAAGILQVTAPR